MMLGMVRVLFAAVLLFVAAAACSSEPKTQSFAEGMALICDAPNHVEPSVEASERAMALARWVDEEVTNQEARKVMASLAEQPSPQARVTKLRDAAERAGITQCDFLDVWADR